MCLIFAVVLIGFGATTLGDNNTLAYFSIGVGGVLFSIFLYRLSTYKARKAKLTRAD